MDRASRLPLKISAFAGAIIILVTAAVLTLFTQLASSACNQDYRVDETIKAGSQNLQAQVAQSSSELQKGLSDKRCIDKNQAMLFVLGKSGDYSFWMKNMHFPIDIIWLDSRREIIQIDHDVQPSSYPKVFSPSQPAAYVIELKADEANALSLHEGQLLNF